METWTDEVIAQARQLIHLQDKLTASLGLAIHQGINNQNYNLVSKLLNTIEHDARLLERSSQDLIALRPKRRQGGRPPKWFEIAEEVLYSAIQVQRTIGQIRQERIGNYWKIIGTRLNKSYTTCRKPQRELINIIPYSGESDSIQPMTELLDTLEMGVVTENQSGRRWKRNYE